MPQADKTAAKILVGVAATLAVVGIGTKIGVVDHYKDTYQRYNKYNKPRTTTSQKHNDEPKIIYDKNCPYMHHDGTQLPPDQSGGDVLPSAPLAEDVDLAAPMQEPSAPPAPSAQNAYWLGFVNDLQYANESSFQMTQQAIDNNQTWVYADAYAGLNNQQQTQASSKPQTTSVYADAFEIQQQQPTQTPQQQGQPLYPDLSAQQQTPDQQVPSSPGIPMPQAQYPSSYQAPTAPTAPPQYQPAPAIVQPAQQQSPFGQFVPNVVRFNCSLSKKTDRHDKGGNLIRPLPKCSMCPNFKLKDIKWVMFDDGKCRRVKHGFYNGFAMWHGDCLISTFEDDNGYERIIYWTR